MRALLHGGQAVRVLDNLSTGRRENLDGLDVDFQLGSVEDPDTVGRALEG